LAFYGSLGLYWGLQMQEYHAFVLGPDGHIAYRHDLRCSDDEAAKERAKQLVNGHGVELWQLDRMVATFTRRE
jgi:hypothetical protein